MTPIEILMADRAKCTDRLDVLAEHLVDPALQRVTRDRYRDESDLLLARLEHLDGIRYCERCENAEVEDDGDLCAGCHDAAGERQAARAAEGL